MIKTFISYHHAYDQKYKDALAKWATEAGLIVDMSVHAGDINDNLATETIRQIIRDEYLRDSEVTIVLCGAETRFRKHVDWEVKSSMWNGQINKQSGILAITLPSSNSSSWHAAYPNEAQFIYPDYQGNWYTTWTLEDYKANFPTMPIRILENIVNPNAKISIAPWDRIYGKTIEFSFLLHKTAEAGKTNFYDLARPMRKKNFNPKTDLWDIRT